MKKTLLLLPLLASTASGAVIVPVTASASSDKPTSPASRLIDGSGLFTDVTETTADNSLTGIHFDTGTGPHTTARSWAWGDGGAILIRDQWVQFNLGGSFNVTDAYIWQTTFSGTGRQTRTFDIEYSTDGTNYFVASADQQLAQIATPANGSTAETFSFSTVTASWMRIGIDGTYERAAGDRNWLGGIGEVRFEGTAVPVPSAVPEPSSLSLLGLGGLLVAARRRRA